MTTIAGIARAAVLVDLEISIYSGRKQDKRRMNVLVVPQLRMREAAWFRLTCIFIS